MSKLALYFLFLKKWPQIAIFVSLFMRGFWNSGILARLFFMSKYKTKYGFFFLYVQQYNNGIYS